MTQGGDAGQQQQAGGQAETVEYATLEKFSGLNLSQPSGTFGQPNKLENIYLDRRGGYTTIPGMAAVAQFPNAYIQKIAQFSGTDLVAVTTTIPGPGDRYINFLKISTGLTLYSALATAYPSGGTYKSGLYVVWNYGQGDGGIVLYSADYSTINSGSTDPAIQTTEINKKSGLTITLVESGGYGTAPNGNAPFSYGAGTLSGFNPNRTYYLFLYVQDAPAPAGGNVGTTLNPAPPKPRRIVPMIYQIRGSLGGMTTEFKVVVNNPNLLQIFAYAEATLMKRPFEEWQNSDIQRHNNQAITVNQTVLYGIFDPTGNGGSFWRYQALNAGTTGPTVPDPDTLPTAYNARFVDGDVTFVSLGRVDDADDTFIKHLGKVGNAPIQYAQPDAIIPEFDRVVYQDFAQLYTLNTANTTEVYRSKKDKADDFTPASFFPLGSITESHLNRTWVVAESIWRTYATANINVGAAVEISLPSWEMAKRKRTVYYSEAEAGWSFLERFLALPFTKSVNIVAMHSLGDYLVFLGDADAAVLSGDSEANFFVKGLDIPGGYAQNLGVVVAGVLYYRGVGGIFRLSGGQAERISDDIAPIVPHQVGPFEAVSRDDTHIQFQLDLLTTAVYDTVSNGWTTIATPNRYANAGEVSLNYFNDTVYSMTGQPNRIGTIGYTGMELGSKLHRLTVRSLSMYADGLGSVDTLMQAHTQKGIQPLSTSRPHLVNQTGQYMQWRYRNMQGQSFDMQIKLLPNLAPITLKPGITIEVYKGEVLRRGYGG